MKLQVVIGEVHEAWERMADSHFSTAEDRQNALSVAVREGLFRELVANRETGAPVERFLKIASLSPAFLQIEESRDILLEWVAPFRPADVRRLPESGSRQRPGTAPATMSTAYGAMVLGNVVAEALPEEMLVRLRPRLKQVLGRYRIPVDDAEDLIQDAFLSTIFKWDTIKDPEAWLLVTLRNRCVVYWRKRRNTLYNSVDTAILELLSEPMQAPEERVELVQDLDRLLKELPARCQKLLRLRYGLGFDSSEIAEKMGHPVSSVQKVARRCMAALTYQLVTRGFSPDS